MNWLEGVRWKVLLKIILSNCSLCLSLSKDTCLVVKNELGAVANSEVIFDWVEHPAYLEFTYSEDIARKRRFFYGISDTDIVCCITGHLKPYKGLEQFVEQFVEQFSHLTALTNRRIYLQIAGRPVSTSYLKKLKRVAQDRPNVLIKGQRVDDQELNSILAASDFFIFNSIDYLHSGSIMAALSAGLIVVANLTPFTKSLQDSLGPNYIITFEQFYEGISNGNLTNINPLERTQRSRYVQARFSHHGLSIQLKERLSRFDG
nr:glycosyltransferase [Roseibium sp. CAU 1639]